MKAPVMDCERVYMLLVCLRVMLVFAPQMGYIHPDEFFQTPEVVAGDVLDVQHQRTWEFTWSDPIRTIVIPYIICGPVFFLLGLLKIATPYTVLLLPRLVVTAAGLVMDRCVFLLCRKLNNNGHISLFLYATSYVSWTYMTRTFSNTVETVLFTIMLLATFDACEEKRPRKRQHWALDSIFIAAVMTIGTFNRPTFLIFAFVPVSLWLWNIVSSKRHINDRINLFINHTSVMAAVSLHISAIFVLIDTLYYRYEVVRKIPGEFSNCVYSDSKLECFRNLFTNYRPSIVISPYNFIAYNSQSANLAQHGTHAWCSHFVFNLPLLLGPAAAFVLWRIFKNLMNLVLGGALKLDQDVYLDDVKVVGVFAVPMFVLSFFSHQEPRFLLPLVPLGFVIATKSLLYFQSKTRIFIFIAFCIFNVFGYAVFGFMHQSGVLRGIVNLREKVSEGKGDSHVVFYHTYMPPEHLFLYPEDASHKLHIYDLAGASFEQLERTMERIRTTASVQKDGWAGIWVVAPRTVVEDIKKLNVKYSKDVERYMHISMEDPPRIMEWLKGEVSWYDLLGDFNLVVAEVKSWKVFKT